LIWKRKKIKILVNPNLLGGKLFDFLKELEDKGFWVDGFFEYDPSNQAEIEGIFNKYGMPFQDEN